MSGQSEQNEPQLPALGRTSDNAPSDGLEPALPGRPICLLTMRIARHPRVTVNEELLEHAIRNCGSKGDFPRRHRTRTAVLLIASAAMEPGKGYSESEVADILRQFTPHGADEQTKRVYMIELGMLDRFADGSQYWLSDRWRTFVDIAPEVESALPRWAARMAEARRNWRPSQTWG